MGVINVLYDEYNGVLSTLEINQAINVLNSTLAALVANPDKIAGKDIVAITDSLRTISAMLPNIQEFENIDKNGALTSIKDNAKQLAEHFQQEQDGDYLKDFTKNVQSATSNLNTLVTNVKNAELNEHNAQQNTLLKEYNLENSPFTNNNDASTNIPYSKEQREKEYLLLNEQSKNVIDSAYSGLCENTSTLMKIGIALGNAVKKTIGVMKKSAKEAGFVGTAVAVVPAIPASIASGFVGGIFGKKGAELVGCGVGGATILGGAISGAIIGAGLGVIGGIVYSGYTGLRDFAARAQNLSNPENKNQVNDIYHNMLKNNFGIVQAQLIDEKLKQHKHSSQSKAESLNENTLSNNQNRNMNRVTSIRNGGFTVGNETFAPF